MNSSSPFYSLSTIPSTKTKSDILIQQESLSSSTINSFSTNFSNEMANFTNETQLNNIRNLKNKIIAKQISPSQLYGKVLLMIDPILDFISSDKFNDSSIVDFCEFFNYLFQEIPQEILKKIQTRLLTHQFSANTLIILAYLIHSFQESPYDSASTHFFKNFINLSFYQLQKELLPHTLTASKNNDALYKSVSVEKFNKICTFIVDSENIDSFFNQENDFEIGNEVDNSIFLNNYTVENLFNYHDNSNSTIQSGSNSNPTSFFNSTNTNNPSNSNPESNYPSINKEFKIFEKLFSQDQISRFLLYFLQSKEMRENNSMNKYWDDFIQILITQFKCKTELAQFASYFISIGKINLLPKQFYMNKDFIELSDKNSIIQLLKILSIDDIENNSFLLAYILTRYRDSDVATLFLKKCQELDYTLNNCFFNELAKLKEKSILVTDNNQTYDFSEIVNRLNQFEIDEDFLNYLARYKFKFSESISVYLSGKVNLKNVNLEYFLQVLHAPALLYKHDEITDFVLSCDNIDVLNNITDNFPQNNTREYVHNNLFKDPRFWSHLISIYGFNSIKHFSELFLENNRENEIGRLVALIFLEDFPKNMSTPFYYFAKLVLKGHQNTFSTCSETRELLSRFDCFYSRQFWRLFTCPNLIIETARKSREKESYNYLILGLSLVQIFMTSEVNSSISDPFIKEFYAFEPAGEALIKESLRYLRNNENYFVVEDASNEVLKLISIGHYYYSALLLNYAPFHIPFFSSLYSLIVFIIILNDMKYFKNRLFEQSKGFFNGILNAAFNIKNIKEAFNSTFSAKDELIDLFLSKISSGDLHDDFPLKTDDENLKWVRIVFEDNKYLATNLGYSKSLSHFFGKLTQSTNSFICPITAQFIMSKIDYLLELFYMYPCNFFIIKNDVLEKFVLNKIKSEGINFRVINFIKSSISQFSNSLNWQQADLNSMIQSLIDQNSISDISTIFDFCRSYMPQYEAVELIRIPNLPLISKISFPWIFKFLSNEDFRNLFSSQSIINLIHTAEPKHFDAIIRVVEGILDDDETVSNRCTFLAQKEKSVFSIGENFSFASRLALVNYNQLVPYNINFLKGLYRVYEDSFFDFNDHILIERLDFVPLNMNSEFSIAFLNELIRDAIMTNSYQMFHLLYCIANSHLFLFVNHTGNENCQIDLISIFKYCIETINFIDINNFNDKFKLFLSCCSFLSSLVLSPYICDTFFNWIFSSFNEFNDNEIFFILHFILNFMKNQVTMKQMIAFCSKYNFILLILTKLQNSENQEEAAKVKPTQEIHEDPINPLISTEPQRNQADSIFNDQFYIDYGIFSDSDIENNLNTINFDNDVVETQTPSFKSSIKVNPHEANQTMSEGMTKTSNLMKREILNLSLEIIKLIDTEFDLFLCKPENHSLIEFDDIFRNVSPNPIYKGSYNDPFGIPIFKPFSNSFPRDISIPSFQISFFTDILECLNSSLKNSDYIKTFTKTSSICNIDSDLTTVLISKLKDPYQREPINLYSLVDPNEEERNFYQNWDSSSIMKSSGTTLLKDIVYIDPEDYDFMDEGAQTSLLRQKLPPLLNINDLYVQRFLSRAPSWAKEILTNSTIRAILPPRYLIEIYRITFLINQLRNKVKRKNNSKNDNDILYENSAKLINQLLSNSDIIKAKLSFVNNLRNNNLYISMKDIKSICSFLFSSINCDSFVKNVLCFGNKYFSVNSSIDDIICILIIFESIKSSKFFPSNFIAQSAVNVFFVVGRSNFANPDIAILSCSLFSSLGNLIPEYGIQVFETCLEMKSSRSYDCLDYISQLPDNVKQKLVKYVSDLIDNDAFMANLDKSIQERSADPLKNSDENNNDSNNYCTISFIKKIVKNFPTIVKQNANKFLEILDCILSRKVYCTIVGLIAGILCPPKIPLNKLKSLGSAPISSTKPASSMQQEQQIGSNDAQSLSQQPSQIANNPLITMNASVQADQVASFLLPNENDNRPLLSFNENEDYLLSYGVPNIIYRTYPEFWKVIGPNLSMFNKLIERNLNMLRAELSFLRSYPEVLSFNCKILLFRRHQNIQQWKQQQQLQNEYQREGGIHAFNSVIMTINNPNGSRGGNRISFINSNSINNANSGNSSRRSVSTSSFGTLTNNAIAHSPSNESIINIQFNNSSVSMNNNSGNEAHNARNLRISNPQSINLGINSTASNPGIAAPSRDTNSSSNENLRAGGIIRPMIKVRRSHILQDTYNVFGPAFNGFSIMPIRDIFVRFYGEPGIDLGGLTKEWISTTIKELFNQDYGLFKETTDGFSLFPNPFSSVNPEHLGYFELAGRIIGIALAKDINIDINLAIPLLKSLLEQRMTIKDVGYIDSQMLKSLSWINENDNIDSIDVYFVVSTENSFGVKETIELIKNGSNIQVTDANKNQFIELMANYYLNSSVESQIKAFKKGFYSIVPYTFIRIFTPLELGLMITGVNKIDIDDMRKNCVYEKPYHENHHIVKMFFSAIAKWNQIDLHHLLKFITGLANIPVGGFSSLSEKKKPLTISPGGDRGRLPQAHTCFNRIDIPAYKTEDELNSKLRFAIYECDNFLLI